MISGCTPYAAHVLSVSHDLVGNQKCDKNNSNGYFDCTLDRTDSKPTKPVIPVQTSGVGRTCLSDGRNVCR